MEPLLVLITIISVVAAVMMFTLRNQERSRTEQFAQRVPALEKAKADAEDEFRKRKDTLEARTAELAEAKDKLREAKKRLHDEKEVNRKDEVDRARAQGEREAQSAVETARRDASEARDEARRLKAELDALAGRQKRSPRPESTEAKAPAPGPSVEAAAAPAAPAEPRPPRPLTEPEQNRINMLERAAVKQAERVKQLEEDGRRQQKRADANDRVYKVAKSEVELTRSKLTGLESRLNRALLELDKLRAAAFKAGLGDELVKATQAANAESDAREEQERAQASSAGSAESPGAGTPPPVATAPAAPSSEAKV